jgi:hypothetical protein
VKHDSKKSEHGMKKKLSTGCKIFTILSLAGAVAPSYALAYVDPNTGGYVFQIFFPIVSAIAAGYLFFKNQIRKLFGRLTGKTGK